MSHVCLTNQVQGPYSKLRTSQVSSSILWPKREARRRPIKRGSVTYRKNREDKVSKIDISFISTVCHVCLTVSEIIANWLTQNDFKLIDIPQKQNEWAPAKVTLLRPKPKEYLKGETIYKNCVSKSFLFL